MRLWRSQRMIPYLDAQMCVSRCDLESRTRAPVLNASQLPATVRLWRALTQRATLCLDVGASYGAFTLAGHYNHNRCFAFEPHDGVVRYLAKSIQTHPNQGRITVFPMAVSDRTSDATFFLDRRKSGCSSLHISPRFRSRPRMVSVETIRLDDIRRAGDELVLLKTDTEGHEAQVLDGACQLLTHPIVGISEYSPDLLAAAGVNPCEFLRSLTERFDCWIIHDKPVEFITRINGNIPTGGNIVYTNQPELFAWALSAIGDQS